MYGSGKSDDPVHTGQAGSGNATSSNRTGDDMPGANRADVDNPYYKGNQPSTTGAAGTSGYSTEPSSTSRVPGTFDDDTATTASVKSGVIGESQGGSALAGSGATDSSTNKPLPMEPESATGHSGYGPHDSSLANKADPRVDSDLDGSRGLGSSTTGTGSGLTGTSLPDRSVGRSVQTSFFDNSFVDQIVVLDMTIIRLLAHQISAVMPHWELEPEFLGPEPPLIIINVKVKTLVGTLDVPFL